MATTVAVTPSSLHPQLNLRLSAPIKEFIFSNTSEIFNNNILGARKRLPLIICSLIYQILGKNEGLYVKNNEFCQSFVQKVYL